MTININLVLDVILILLLIYNTYDNVLLKRELDRLATDVPTTELDPELGYVFRNLDKKVVMIITNDGVVITKDVIAKGDDRLDSHYVQQLINKTGGQLA